MAENPAAGSLRGHTHDIAVQQRGGADGWYVGQLCSQEAQDAAERIMEAAGDSTLEATIFDGGVAIARILDGGSCPGRQVEVLDYGLMSLIADSARDEKSHYAVDLNVAAAAAWLYEGQRN